MFNFKEIHKKKNYGFTLIELLAVIVIMGLLATVVVVNVAPFLGRSNYEKVKADFAQIEKALELFRFNEMRYPTTNEGLMALVKAPSSLKNNHLYPEEGYIKALPKDPWGNPYLYLRPGVKLKSYDLYTYGADGIEGGSKQNADIGNWTFKE